MEKDSKKTVEYLNDQPWYRALKILNGIFSVLCYIVAFAVIVSFFVNYSEIKESINLSNFLVFIIGLLNIPWSIFWAWLISQIPKWIFFYIYLGTIKPKK